MMPELKKRIQIIMEIKIKKVHTLLDLVISAVVLAAGIGVYFVLPGWGILFGLIGILGRKAGCLSMCLPGRVTVLCWLSTLIMPIMPKGLTIPCWRYLMSR